MRNPSLCSMISVVHSRKFSFSTWNFYHVENIVFAIVLVRLGQQLIAFPLFEDQFALLIVEVLRPSERYKEIEPIPGIFSTQFPAFD